MASIYTGTSGFAYASWRPAFYPDKLPASRFLEHYATRLNAVESNYTFRRLVSEKVLDGWMKVSPAGFLFAVKAHQRITHIKRLKDPQEFLPAFLNTLNPLRAAGRLGPVLFQIPPNLKRDDELLATFLGELPQGLRCVLEVRHASWFEEPVMDLLRRFNVALCRAESEKLVAPDVPTADFVYFRLRKADYSPAERVELAAQAKEHLAAGRDVFAIFKHEDDPAGALYAEELRVACGG
ncbi:MAG: DUF72 domain-containing protein [Bryobacteraceae bacterium]